METDLRLHPRYRTQEAAELSGGEQFAPLDASVVDISLGGCRVRTKRPLQVGLVLNISLAGPISTVVPVEVRYLEETSSDFILGLRFRPSCHAERMSLAKAVFTINQRYWGW